MDHGGWRISGAQTDISHVTSTHVEIPKEIEIPKLRERISATDITVVRTRSLDYYRYYPNKILHTKHISNRRDKIRIT